MRLATGALTTTVFLVATAVAAAQTPSGQALRDLAVKAGVVPVETLMPSFLPEHSDAGRLLFASPELSPTRQVSCASCHVDGLARPDALPAAVGPLGGGDSFLPRDILPLWGRGARGFGVFFWDGRVATDLGSGNVSSQLGSLARTYDPLAVAVHLPPLEIGEMVGADNAAALRAAPVAAAKRIYAEIERRTQDDPVLSQALRRAYGYHIEDITYRDIAESLAAFIRDRFRLQPTRFHGFLFASGTLSEAEIAGGLLFYGRAGCAACHDGPYFSDLKFHAVPVASPAAPDPGRAGVTGVAGDVGRFRTPPLFNVAETAPYFHSGSVADLGAAIRAHVDPRVTLDDADVAELRAFLATLSLVNAGGAAPRGAR
jgi:cytochrome c peroxidase